MKGAVVGSLSANPRSHSTQKCCILAAYWTWWIAWIYVMKRPEILAFICTVMHKASLDMVLMWSALSSWAIFCMYCFSLPLLSACCCQHCLFSHRSIQFILQFIALVIKRVDLFVSIVCLHTTAVQNHTPFLSWVLLGHHAIFRPRENLWAASPHDRKRSFSQVPFPQAAMSVPTQYGGGTGHTDQQLRSQFGGDPYRRPKPSKPEHPLL